MEEVETPRPTREEVLIKVQVAGVNYIDTYHRRGLYPVPLPFIPGIEAAGHVEELGEDVEGLEVGDQVVFCMNMGGYAEKVSVRAAGVARLPDAVTPEEGVAAMCQGMTAHYLTTDCFPLVVGQTILVHAAAGGVGLLLVQMAKRLGVRVIGTVSNERKATLARQAGADEIILYSSEDFAERVQRLTNGRGVDVVYESVGKDTFHKSLNCLRPRGYLILYGQSSGPVEPFDPQILNQKGSLFLTRPSLGHYIADPGEFVMRSSAVLQMIEKEDLNVIIGERLPLEEAGEAHRRLEARQTVGKVLLLP